MSKHKTFLKKWLCCVFICTALTSIMWGCAVAPRKLFIKDISASFDECTIISTKTEKPVSFEDLITDLSRVQIIYLGEKHNDPAHHEIQLRVIKTLFKANQNIAVGMEMFDRTYRQVLSLWSAGELDQAEFLKKVHWYANWKFDFVLYKDIIDFIKKNNIRLVGLNLPPHIPRKIAIGGIESLSNDEKKHLPKKITTSNADHRAYVEQVFKQHHVKGMDNFEFFYTAQCVWEDTMAESVAMNLEDDQMIVMAGNGHIIHKFGIPDRAFSRTGASFRTITLTPAGSEAELSFADYIWVTQVTQKHKKKIRRFSEKYEKGE
jgi:uncharacterized iron-regulated protein